MSFYGQGWQAGSPAYPYHDPGAILGNIRDRLSGTFGDVFAGAQQSWHPDMDMDSDESGWTVKVRLPGITPDEVTIDIVDRVLHVSAKHEATSASSAQASAFAYQFTLPDGVQPDKVSANMNNGLLTIFFPRSEPGPTTATRVDVKDSSSGTEEAAPPAEES
jgi:HSP20 family protein